MRRIRAESLAARRSRLLMPTMFRCRRRNGRGLQVRMSSCTGTAGKWCASNRCRRRSISTNWTVWKSPASRKPSAWPPMLEKRSRTFTPLLGLPAVPAAPRHAELLPWFRRTDRLGAIFDPSATALRSGFSRAGRYSSFAIGCKPRRRTPRFVNCAPCSRSLYSSSDGSAFPAAARTLGRHFPQRPELVKFRHGTALAQLRHKFKTAARWVVGSFD